MKHAGNDIYNKVDVIMYGMETIGSAERSSDAGEMREKFYTVSDGKYSNLLFEKFGKDRVIKELDEFLEHDFFPRYGGGIGITRLMSALKGIKRKKSSKPLSFFK